MVLSCTDKKVPQRNSRPVALFANQSNRFTRASGLANAQTTLALMLQNGTLIAHFAEVDLFQASITT